MRLDSGQYYYRLASVDEYGIESKPVEGTLTVSGSGKSPAFRVAGFIFFLLAAMLIWTSILVNTPFHARYIKAWAVEDGRLEFDFGQNMNYFFYRFRHYTLDHRSLLLIMRSIGAIFVLIAIYMVV
jgi:hypothetical protein